MLSGCTVFCQVWGFDSIEGLEQPWCCADAEAVDISPFFNCSSWNHSQTYQGTYIVRIRIKADKIWKKQINPKTFWHFNCFYDSRVSCATCLLYILTRTWLINQSVTFIVGPWIQPMYTIIILHHIQSNPKKLCSSKSKWDFLTYEICGDKIFRTKTDPSCMFLSIAKRNPFL